MPTLPTLMTMIIAAPGADGQYYRHVRCATIGVRLDFSGHVGSGAAQPGTASVGDGLMGKSAKLPRKCLKPPR